MRWKKKMQALIENDIPALNAACGQMKITAVMIPE